MESFCMGCLIVEKGLAVDLVEREDVLGTRDTLTFH